MQIYKSTIAKSVFVTFLSTFGLPVQVMTKAIVTLDPISMLSDMAAAK